MAGTRQGKQGTQMSVIAYSPRALAQIRRRQASQEARWARKASAVKVSKLTEENLARLTARD